MEVNVVENLVSEKSVINILETWSKIPNLKKEYDFTEYGNDDFYEFIRENMLESVDNIPKKISLNKDLHFMKKIVSKNLKIFQRVQKKIAEDIYNFIKSCN